MKIVVIDNYDSFTYNLVHLVEKITNKKPTVLLNDKFELADLSIFDKIILSPGPGIPKNAGLLIPLIKEYYKTKSILGVCLGHQALAEAFGGNLFNLDTVFHGVSTDIYVSESNPILFKNIPIKFKAGRYHSWAVNKNDLPNDFNITAVDEEGIIMAMEHKFLKLHSVQFHPESILTEYGEELIKNWLNI